MPRDTLDRQIHHIQDEILLLGSMVEQATLNVLDCLKRRDVISAREIYEGDLIINDKRFAIENSILILFATQQPMAHDLRLLAAMLEINTELERMGDYAKGIATISLRMKDEPLLKPLIDIPVMAQKGADMLHRALTAFINEDIEVARAIPEEDDVVDSLYAQVYRELTAFIMQDPTTIKRANWLLWVAHNLERVSDRVTNICERTIFSATGEMRETVSKNLG